MGNLVLGSGSVQPRSGESEWDSSLTDCCTGVPCLMCVQAFLCTGLTVGQVSEQYGEGFGLAFTPMSQVMLRTELRERYNIKGSICKDVCASICCGPCTALQMYKEVDKRHPY